MAFEKSLIVDKGKSNNVGYKYSKIKVDLLNVKERPGIFDLAKTLEGHTINIPVGVQQRGIADIVEESVINLYKRFSVDTVLEKRTKKSTEDFSLIRDGVIHLIDVKSWDINSTFSMPNLSAIEKIKSMLTSSFSEFHYLFVHYERISPTLILVKTVVDCVIEQLPWENLSVANLGNGQLQISSMHKFSLDTNYSVAAWHKLFKQKVVEFKKDLLAKIENSIKDWED